jgi:AcrR family transcriptional regulator
LSALVDPSAPRAPDRRARRTRAAIVAAFNRLFLERGYTGLNPAVVAAAADVGRSTFYEHFHSLDDLLAHALSPILAPLADACFEPALPDRAAAVVEHFWDNRRLARRLLSGDAHDVVRRAFAGQIAEALTRRVDASRIASARLEPELIALAVAAGQLELLTAWLSGRSSRSAREFAGALHAAGRALVMALSGSA